MSGSGPVGLSGLDFSGMPAATNESSKRQQPRASCLIAVLVTAFLSARASADCTLTTTGNVPLPDLGPGLYQSFSGGPYPGGNSTRPPAHEAAGVNIGTNNIAPRNAAGAVDLVNGKIVMISVGMSNTNDE